MGYVAIIDYGLGNLRSVAGAVERVGFEPVITHSPEALEKADKLILPGVGAFGDGMHNLRQRGLDGILNRLVLKEHKPILGICLGFQLMSSESMEFGNHQGLGWLDAVCRRIDTDGKLLLPHVGWNDLFQVEESILFREIPEDALFYYVHSYHVVCKDLGLIVGECEYGDRFTSVIERDNIYATQFHPEKSQKHGLRLLENFLTFAR